MDSTFSKGPYIVMEESFWLVGSGAGMPVVSYEDLRFHVPDLNICVMWNCTFAAAPKPPKAPRDGMLRRIRHWLPKFLGELAVPRLQPFPLTP